MRIVEPLLSATEERDLARAVEVGLYADHLLDDPAGHPRHCAATLQDLADEGREAWRRLVLANAGLVKLLARRYGRGEPGLTDDLIQEGFVALAEGLRRYDWARGVRLSTHVWHWVKHHLTRTMRQVSLWDATTAPVVDDIAAPHPGDDPTRLTPGLLTSLTARERAVLLARAQGCSFKELTARFGLSSAMLRRIERSAAEKGRRHQLGLDAA